MWVVAAGVPGTAEETRYVDVAGAQIAFRSFPGAGPPVLFNFGIAPGLLIAEFPLLRPLFDRLTRAFSVILYDPQGTGRSDPIPIGIRPTPDDHAAQMLAVLDAAQMTRAWVIGYDSGAAASIALSVAAPERIAGLALVQASARYIAAEDYPIGRSEDATARMIEERRRTHGTNAHASWAPSVADDPRVRVGWAQFEQYWGSRNQLGLILDGAMHYDVRPLLSRVSVPTLVVQLSGTHLREHGHYVAERIPAARHVEIDSPDHLWFLGPSCDLVMDEVEHFITGVAPVADANRVLTAVVFVDIVASTDRARRVGDQRWRQLLDEFDTTGSTEVARGGGRVVKRTGDGLLALFPSATAAARTAVRLVAVARALGLEIRGGVHVADVELRGDDVGGIGVHVGARLMTAAAPGQVLVSSTAATAADGGHVRLRDAGTRSLKGFAQPWPVFDASAD